MERYFFITPNDRKLYLLWNNIRYASIDNNKHIRYICDHINDFIPKVILESEYLLLLSNDVNYVVVAYDKVKLFDVYILEHSQKYNINDVVDKLVNYDCKINLDFDNDIHIIKVEL